MHQQIQHISRIGTSAAHHHLQYITFSDASLIPQPSSYLISLSHIIFKNMAHGGSFNHFIFVFACTVDPDFGAHDLNGQTKVFQEVIADSKTWKYNLLVFQIPDHNLCHKWLVEGFPLFRPTDDVITSIFLAFHSRKLLRPIIDFMRSRCFQSYFSQLTSHFQISESLIFIFLFIEIGCPERKPPVRKMHFQPPNMTF